MNHPGWCSGRPARRSAWLLAATPLRAEVLVVTLPGTGAPAPQIERFGPAVLVKARRQELR